MPTLSQHACFSCRKVFKKPHEYRFADKQGVRPARTVRNCPQCGSEMIYMSYKFRAPKADDVREWSRIETALPTREGDFPDWQRVWVRRIPHMIEAGLVL